MSQKKRFLSVVCLLLVICLCVTTCVMTRPDDPTEPPAGTSGSTLPTAVPTTGIPFPSTGVSNPTAGVTFPSTGVTDPSGSTDPSMGGTDPTAGITDPSTGSTDPSTGETDPSTGPSGPGSDYKPDSRITYSYAGYECAAFCWEDSNPAACRVGYRLSGTNGYTYIDSPLIRQAAGGQLRADIVGLQGGKAYDFIIYRSDGTAMTAEKMTISSYDRSGYAHFGYTQGVGAYQDNGELKSGALVIYLTESNKNDVLAYAYVNGKQVDISPYMKGRTGIGEMLNNRRYSGEDRFNIGIAKLCEVYGAVTIRILGTVKAEQNADGTSTIIGLTDYNSTGNGGSVGDNGRIARMVNAKNLTIEGIGEDACVYGWGFHFIANDPTNQRPGVGKSFEVRNIRFEGYPEDAVGMEGVQGTSVSASGEISGSSSTSAKLLSPVERCWIHHNSFYPGYCAKPAESDKAEGDGSCDFKRGRYYTLSYNYFVDCHKTNLIGSSDSSLQFDITFHHNYWENCGSRIPLLRNANLHFYNNYVSNDISKSVGSTGNKLALSYVSSVRANSYMFAENNYYDGCKNPVLTTSGGVVKSYGNTYYACFEDDMSNRVSSRTEDVSNRCKYIAGGIDYSKFDTDPKLFYYNASKKCSDCYLTDAVTARREVMQRAGTMKHAGTVVKTNMNNYTPGSVLQMTGDALKVNLNGITAGSTVHGIYFAAKGGSAGLKGKGQVITFTLLGDTEIQVTVLATDKDVNLGELVDMGGKVWAGKFTEFSGTLPKGTYFIASGSKDKEVTVTSLVFRSAVTPAQKIAAVEAAIDAIPKTITLSEACKAAIDAAEAAYQALTAAQQAQVSNAQTLAKAKAQYQALADAQQPALLKQLLAEMPDTVTRENAQQFAKVKALYDSISPGKRNLTAAEQAKYDSLLAQYEALKQEAVVAIFTGNDPSLASGAGFTVSGNYKIGVSFEYNGTTYEKPLKMESSTSVTFTTAGSATITLKLDVGSKAIKIDGTKYTADADGFVTATLAAGNHSITKSDVCNLCYIILE